MASPTYIEVITNSNEYSRYEKGREVITATASIEGGASYVDEPILFELVKARRSRDVVVASQTVYANSQFDPGELDAEFDIRNIVDHNLYNLVRHGKYFIRASSLATQATATIGTGADGMVDIDVSPGAHGNQYTVEVVVPSGDSDLSVTAGSSPNEIIVSLATRGGVVLGAENRAVYVSSLINQYGYHLGIKARYTGNGHGQFTGPEGPVQFTGGKDEVYGESSDFDVRIVTVDRFKKDYLFGLDLRATNVLQVTTDLQNITGVEIVEVSGNHPVGLFNLNYIYEDNSVPAEVILNSADPDGSLLIRPIAPIIGATGNQITANVVVPTVDGPLEVTQEGLELRIVLSMTGGVLDPLANTAALVGAAVEALGTFEVEVGGAGTGSLVAPESIKFTGGETAIRRALQWLNGPEIEITKPGEYILPASGGENGNSSVSCAGPGFGGNDYIKVRVGLLSRLPTESVSDQVLVENKPMDDETLARFIDEALSFLEEDILYVYFEPTVVTTERDPTTIQYDSSFNAPTPIYANPDYDKITTPLTYFVPRAKGNTWINIQTPFMSVLRVDSLFGQIANTRVLDVDLEWIEMSEHGGFMQLVPYNQETAFNFTGIVWVNALRGATELPNFWHYTMLVGLREATPDLQDLLGRYAAIKALTTAALAFRPGLGSVSLSRDGVSQSTSYLNQQKYGAFTGAIQSHMDWVDKYIANYKARYRGLSMVVV